MKQCSLAVFRLVDIVVEYTLTMIGFQGLITELEVWKLHHLTLKVNHDQNTFQGDSDKPKIRTVHDRKEMGILGTERANASETADKCISVPETQDKAMERENEILASTRAIHRRVRSNIRRGGRGIKAGAVLGAPTRRPRASPTRGARLNNDQTRRIGRVLIEIDVE
ncbi:hypothetical protein EVAR_27212_1 [Eumeta japonica]|uniref:Uncharacterized protein n=1 Tax=Eumeta variegata TaxID=151549 RepID=A0A4C1VXB1_EUMVA|nr:hypothetical protein EVAR_27212_1 [Eumeta japonica]